MANVSIYRDFDEITRGIQNLRSEWENGKHKKTGNSYAHIWQIMNKDCQFYRKERNIYQGKIADLSKDFRPEVVAKKREPIDSAFNKLIAVISATHRSMVKDFTRSRHDQLRKMMRTAPTQSMVNLLETLKMRDDLDEVELHDLLPLFFDNYHGMRALQSISRQNGITLTAPVQLDCATMHKMIDEAETYLLGACAEMCKPHDEVAFDYRAFFTVNSEMENEVYDSTYRNFINTLDYVPQLQDCSVEKSKLSAAEKAKIEWLYHDVSQSASIAEHTKKVMEAHPEMVDLLKLSDYAEYVEIVEAAKETA